MRRKRPGILSDGVIFLHDNTSPYCSQNSRIAPKVQVGNLEPPPYSPDLARSDYFLFPKLKDRLSGINFSSDSDVNTAAEN
ncbi:hypothetical protein AVEN_157628-1 [Araneus ventricosus]|uniref:Histone-lysine N-methyltransferase SETMAR n=1 Tax=Araneus ventricosus TaxID=182803 RepID=A0A4Y1ZWA3_ARAVE|nr:hypothetical protein AVEN_9910-1 [Araneus ventricosus]GBL69961.1 hypothetical protein AVEN_33869-1 [Araneus ventricosus]GBL70058.1 hypothetical protein AVEN_90223-1 [Araneus ventricosus]GBL70445.1 hypothetical protein AVEN_157628-1 [Araneus ventricosus]